MRLSVSPKVNFLSIRARIISVRSVPISEHENTDNNAQRALTHLELREFETSAKKSAAEHGRMKDLLDVKTYMHALPPPEKVILFRGE